MAGSGRGGRAYAGAACQGSCALAVILGICRDNGKENGNYIITGYIYILGLYGDNGFVWDVVQ